MKDLYKILGLNRKASLFDIKRAYRKLALENHPDKGGSNETMSLIAEAYSTLSDVETRHRFDENWEAFKAGSDSDEAAVDEAIALEVGSAIPFSKQFRKMHAQAIFKYSLRPLPKKTSNAYFTPPTETEKYMLNLGDTELGQYDNLFDYLSALELLPTLTPQPFSIKERLNVQLASTIWCDVLAGRYFKQSLIQLSNYLSQQIQLLNGIRLCEKEFYIALKDVVQLLVDKNPEKRETLILSLEKTSAFLEQSTSSSDTAMDAFSFIYSARFRQLFAYALSLYWLSPESTHMHQAFKNLRGFKESHELLQFFRDRAAQNQHTGLTSTIQYIKLLHTFEKDMHTVEQSKYTAADLREAAFHGLDWIGVFLTNSDRKMIVNLFLQVGIKFQKAAKLEKQAAVKISDEKLALEMYMTAFHFANKLKPDIEQYILNHILRKMDKLIYDLEALKDIIPSLQHRALQLANIFPFFESCRSNINLTFSPDKRLLLMRSLLNHLVNIIDHNHAHPESPIPLDHKITTILHQAYEACLKKWYESIYDEATEKKLRLDLMEQLLNEKGWSFAEMETNLQSPWIMVARDEAEWLKPTRVLPFIDDPNLTIFKALNGAEIDEKTGQIVFYMSPLLSNHVPSQKLVTLADLRQIIERTIDHGFFSLDPVDPDMPYHPFQTMRFGPTQLYESELMHSMLLTDYILKFMTTNQEVQAAYPYDRRSVETMIQHLPLHLQNVIQRFREASKLKNTEGEMTRFWIEAEDIDLNFSQEESRYCPKTRINIGPLKMVIKKHKLQRDLDGNLKDTANDNEGWLAYRLTEEEFSELQQGKRKIEGHAIIFIELVYEVFFWKNDQVLKQHIPIQEEGRNNGEDLVIFMNTLKKESDGMLVMNTDNQPAFVRCIKVMAKQAGLDHRYSPEFLFAHEFTTHYDEFCFHLPIFGRLRELSRMTVLAHFLNNIRQSNKERLTVYNNYLTKQPLDLDNPIQKGIYDIILDKKQKVTHAFDEQKRKEQSLYYQSKAETEVANIKNKIGPITLANHQACKATLNQHFDQELQYRVYNYNQVLEDCLKGNNTALVNALADKYAKEDWLVFTNNFSASSTFQVSNAYKTNNPEAINKISEQEAHFFVQDLCKKSETVEQHLVRMGLGKIAPPEERDLEDQCTWIPATINHHYYTDGGRQSLFVYGGVIVAPKLNIKQGGGPLQGQRICFQGGDGQPPSRGNGGNSGSGGGGSGGGSGDGSGGFNRNNITKNCQNHHIIPQQLKDHPLIRAAGFDIHSCANRIFLPKPGTAGSSAPDNAASMTSQQRAELPWQQRRAFHSGRHDGQVVRGINDKMSRIYESGKNNNWTQAQYNQELRKTIGEYRQQLKQGNISLNKHHRSWIERTQPTTR